MALVFSFLVAFHASSARASSSLTLEDILKKVDERGKNLRSLSATLFQKRWTDILEEFDAGEEGLFYFLKKKGMAYIRKDIVRPQQNFLVIRKGEVLFYQPKIKQVQRYSLGNNRDKAEFLLLGFGSRAKSLTEAYRIRLLSTDKIANHEVYTLELVPKSGEISAYFSKIILWIDPRLWVPIRQKLVEPTRDFLLIEFKDILLNPGVPESKFNLRFPKGVKILGQ